MTDLDTEFSGTARFEIRRRLGAGGMGVVYEAYDRERSEVVALKTLRHRNVSSGLYRFKNEFRALADVAHPNLINLYEFLVEDDHWFFIMERIEGVHFLDYVSIGAPAVPAHDGPFISSAITSPAQGRRSLQRSEPTLPLDSQTSRPVREMAPQHGFREPELRSALSQLAEGLVALHDKAILHRDIKSSNVLVTSGGRVVILDFGISMERATRAPDEDGVLVGTPSYMSPEQVLSEAITEASDWYSVGVMTYRALTGRYPFEGSIEDIIRNKVRTEPCWPSEVAEGLPTDLSALCRDLLRRQPDARPTGREVLARLGQSNSMVAPAFGAVSETPFLGRESLLGELRLAFEHVRNGATISVYIRGASGMGKSALVRHFLDGLNLDDAALVLSGRCYERESVPYKAVDGIIDRLSRYLMTLPEERRRALVPADIAALSRLFPVLQQVEGVDRPSRFDQEQTRDPLALRRRGFAVLRTMLTRIGEERPLVLSIDDLQWSDADSLILLEDLLRQPDPPRLLLLASFRAEEIGAKPFLQDLLKQTDSDVRRELRVESLTAAESRRLARAVLGRAGASDDAVVDTIVTEAEGNPFLVEQLAVSVLEANATTTRGVSLADVLNSRLRNLPAGARPMLSTLAVAGRPVDSAVAYAATRFTGDERPLMAALHAARLVRTSGSAGRVELYHDRIRETLLALIQPERRKDIHRSLADTLEAKGIDDPEGLYEHYMAADEPGHAGMYAIVAGRKAAAALAFDQAALYYRRALDIAPIRGIDSIELRATLGDALVNAGRSSDAARVLLDLAGRVDSDRGLDLQRRAAEQLLMGGHTDQGIDVIRRVLAQVHLKLPEGPKRALFSLLLRRAHLRLRGLRFVDRGFAEVSRADLQRIDICWAVAAGLSLSDTIRGADFQTRNLLLALRAGDLERIARAIAIETGFSAIPGGPNNRRAAELQRMAKTLADRVGQPHAMGVAALWAGVAACLLGQWKKAFECCDRALDILSDRCVGVALDMATAQRFLLYSLMNLGEIRELCRRFPMVLADAKERGNRYLTTDLRTAMNVVWLVDDDPDRARGEVSGALREWSQRGFLLQHYYALQALTQIDLYAGAGRPAYRRVEEQWRALKRSLLLQIQTVRIEAMYFRGRSALAAASAGEDAAGCLRLSDRMAQRIANEKMPWSKPVASVLWAGAASLRGNTSRAADLLSDAADDFSRVDMALYAAVARRRLGELRADDAGGRLVAESDLWMANQRIKNPRRMARMLAPGFPSDRES